MNKTVWAYVGVLVTMLLLDAVWLGVVAKEFYKTQLGALMLEEPKLGAAGVFYLLYAAGMVLFVVRPALLGGGGIGRAALYGAAFGLIAYMTYDLSNLATLRGWSLTLVAADLVWGTVISALAASAGWWLAQRMAP